MSADERHARGMPRALPGATVLQIIPSLVEEPVARTAVDVALALLRSGARAIVAGADGPLVSELQGFGAEWIRLECETGNPLQLRGNARRLEELIAAERIDLVHACGIGAARSAARAAGRTGAWLVHGYVPSARPHRWRDKPYGRALKGGDRVIACSDYVADRMIERHAVPRERVSVIRRRVDTSVFDPAAVSVERISTLWRAWKIRRGERVILAPRRIAPENGQLNLVDAARLLVNGGLRNVVFVLAGDDRSHVDYARAIHQRAQSQGVGHLVRRIGACPDMPAAYAAAGLVVVPAIEPPLFGQVAAEALAMARPVVASAVGALPEFALAPPRVREEARTGWLAEPDDPIDLARALAAAEAVGATTRRALGARARQLAETSVSPAHVAATTLAVYSSLLEGGG